MAERIGTQAVRREPAIPARPDAEARIAARALWDPNAPTEIDDLIDVESDFYVVRYRRIITICRDLPRRCPPTPTPIGDPQWHERPWAPLTNREWATVEAGADLNAVLEVRELTVPRSYLEQDAMAVYDAARRRDLMRRLADIYNNIAAGAPIPDLQFAPVPS